MLRTRSARLAEPAALDARDAAGWLRTDAVIIAGVALIAAQLGLKAYLLSHFYFRQDDFQLLDHARYSPLNLRYLFTMGPEQLAPAGRVVTWLLVRVSPYNWTLASAITIVLLAAASLAMLRLLHLLFGKRPAILIPLVIFLFTPLTLPGLSFWTTTTLWLPLQLTMILAIDSHIRYVRSGSVAHAVAATAWLGTGMLFDELGVLVPVLVFALTSAYLVPGRWRTAAGRVLKQYWPACLMYGTVAVAYFVVFIIRLPTSVQQPVSPPDFASVLTLASTMLRVGFVPAALGGPWHWLARGGDYGYAAEVPVLTQVSWVLAVLIVAASLLYRRRSLRAWAILAGWILLADLFPVAVSRLTELPATLSGADLHYVADSAPVLALCVGLAFLPVIGEADPYRLARPKPAALVASAIVLTGAFLAGSAWSGVTYLDGTSSARTRDYISTAGSALAQVKPGTVIVSGTTPRYVMYAGFLGRAAQTSQVLAPLAPKNAGIRFTSAPDGAITNVMMFDSLGRLRPAVDVGATSVRPAGTRAACWPVRSAPTTIPLNARVFRYAWIVRLRYSGPASTIQLRLGAAVRDVVMPAGQADVYVRVVGEGRTVLVRRLSAGPPACISSLTVGLMYLARPGPG